MQFKLIHTKTTPAIRMLCFRVTDWCVWYPLWTSYGIWLSKLNLNMKANKLWNCSRQAVVAMDTGQWSRNGGSQGGHGPSNFAEGGACPPQLWFIPNQLLCMESILFKQVYYVLLCQQLYLPHSMHIPFPQTPYSGHFINWPHLHLFFHCLPPPPSGTPSHLGT